MMLTIDEILKNNLNNESPPPLDVEIDIEKLIDVSDFLDEDALKIEGHQVSERFLREYSTHDDIVIKNIDILTRLHNDIINDEYGKVDANGLEDYRSFPKDFLYEKGVFYCENISRLIKRYGYIRHSDLYLINNDTYTERYLLPICLPNGDVYTYMGYCPPQSGSNAPKYMMSDIKFNFIENYMWANQGNIIGNLESLLRYPDAKVIYVCEGMMDAYRINSVMEMPSFAILGSKLTKVKRSILQFYKRKGYLLVYVPDLDKAGENSALLKDNLFDSIMYIPEQYNDFDEMAKIIYLEYIKNNYDKLNSPLPLSQTPVSYIPTEEIKKMNNQMILSFRYTVNLDTVSKPSEDLYNSLMKEFGW